MRATAVPCALTMRRDEKSPPTDYISFTSHFSHLTFFLHPSSPFLPTAFSPSLSRVRACMCKQKKIFCLLHSSYIASRCLLLPLLLLLYLLLSSTSSHQPLLPPLFHNGNVMPPSLSFFYTTASQKRGYYFPSLLPSSTSTIHSFSPSFFFSLFSSLSPFSLACAVDKILSSAVITCIYNLNSYLN